MKSNNDTPMRYWHDDTGAPYEEGECLLPQEDMDKMVEKVLARHAEGNALAVQAKTEILERGYTTVTCPRCRTIPVMTTTPGGERTTVYCECGFVIDAEINF